jgi:hypothetical protein
MNVFMTILAAEQPVWPLWLLLIGFILIGVISVFAMCGRR